MLGEAFAIATGYSVFVIGLTIFMAVVVLPYLRCRTEGSAKRRAAVVGLFALMVLLGYLNISTMLKQEAFSENVPDGSQCRMEGRVYDVRDGSAGGVCVYLNAESIEVYDAGGGRLVSYSGKTRVILYVDEADSFIPGDVVRLEGKVSRPSVATNPGAFDARSYYANKGIYLTAGDVRLLGLKRREISVSGFLYKLRTRASQVLDSAFSEADSSVVKAMLLGEKSGLDKDTKRLFQLNGIAHILAISGVHIAIIGMTLFKLLRRISGSYVTAGILAVLVVIMYGVMTGLASSTFRAVVMMAVSVAGSMRGRSSDMLTSAGGAAVIQAAVDPYVVLDAGFLLSFAAVVGMGVFGPMIKRIMPEIRKTTKKTDGRSRLAAEAVYRLGTFMDTLTVNIAVTLATTPLVIYYFYQFPAYSILLNLVIVPLVSFILFLGIGVVTAGLFSPALAGALAVPVEFILDFYRWSCTVMAKLPGSTVNVGHISVKMMIVFYAAVWLVLAAAGDVAERVRVRRDACRSDRDREKCGDEAVHRDREKYRGGRAGLSRWICALRLCAAVAAAIFCAAYEAAGIDSDSKVVYMDVGQGDGILIHTCGGTNILIDGGSSDKSQAGEYIITPVLKYYGAAHVDYAFVTHGDNDHISGIKYLLETANTGIDIENLVIPAYGSRKELSELIELAGLRGTNVLYMKAGQQLTETRKKSKTLLINENLGKFNDKLTLSLLHPDEKTDINDVNELSAVMKVSLSGVDFLFTGDLGDEGESELLASGQDLSADILKVGHHGSRYSSSSDFLAAVSPSLAVISAGENNSYGHPHEETLGRLYDAGADVLCTIDRGAVCVRFSEGKFRTETYK